MHNKKLERVLVKLAVMAAGTAAIGATYRSAQKAEATVDKKYEEQHGIKPGRIL